MIFRTFARAVVLAGCLVWLAARGWIAAQQPAAAAPKLPRLVVPEYVAPDSAETKLAPGVVRRCGSPRFRHGLYVNSPPFFSPQGKTVYVAGDHQLVAFDTDTGRVQFKYDYGGYNVTFRDLGEHGIRAEFRQGPEQGNFALLEHTTGRELKRGEAYSGERLPAPLQPLADSSRGLVFQQVSSDPRRGPSIIRKALLYDLKTGRQLAVLGEMALWTWTETQRGDRLAMITSAAELRVFDTSDGSRLATLPLMLGSYSSPTRPVISRDGRAVYVWQRHERTFRLTQLDVESGKTRVLLEDSLTRPLAVSPDRTLLACLRNDAKSPQRAPVWSVYRLEDMQQLHVVDVRPSATSVAFSPDGKSLWLLSQCGLARFDLERGRLDENSCDSLSPPTALAFSADGNRLFGAASGEIITWNVATGRECAPRKRLPEDARLSGRLKCVSVTADGDSSIWTGGSHVVRFSGDSETACFYAPNSGPERAYALTPDRRRIVYDAYYGELEYGDLDTGETLRQLLPAARPRQHYLMVVAPDNNTLAVIHTAAEAAKPDETVDIELWDLARGKKTGTLTQAGNMRQMRLHFPQDSRELWTWYGKRLSVWDVAGGKLLGTRNVELSPTWMDEFMPNGHRFLRDGYRKLHLIEAHTGQICKTWECYDWRKTAAAFSPDMRLLAVACPDGPVMLCDVYGTFAAPIAPDPRPTEELWEALASDDSARAYEAVCELIRRGDESVAMLKVRLQPESPRGRWSALIAQLDDDEFATREAATKELAGAPEAVVPLLEAALKTTRSQEQRERLRRLVGGHRGFPLPPARLREARAVEVLEVLRTDAALALLESLSEFDADSRVAREARGALERLSPTAGQK